LYPLDCVDRLSVLDGLFMSQPRWAAVDEYLGELLAPCDPALEGALAASAAAGLPAIQVSPLQGRLYAEMDAGPI
jgi:hypothetical protein